MANAKSLIKEYNGKCCGFWKRISRFIQVVITEVLVMVLLLLLLVPQIILKVGRCRLTLSEEERERERERRFRVYEETPAFRPGPRRLSLSNPR